MTAPRIRATVLGVIFLIALLAVAVPEIGR